MGAVQIPFVPAEQQAAALAALVDALFDTVVQSELGGAVLAPDEQLTRLRRAEADLRGEVTHEAVSNRACIAPRRSGGPDSAPAPRASGAGGGAQERRRAQAAGHRAAAQEPRGAEAGGQGEQEEGMVCVKKWAALHSTKPAGHMLRRSISGAVRRLSSVASASVAPFSDSVVTVCRERASRSSVRCGALGMKCGMTQAWTPDGKIVPLTVVELQDLQVTAVRTPEKDGITALQLGGGWQKRKRLSAALAGQFETRGLPLKRYLRDFRVSEDALLPIGTSITANHFVEGQHVDVQGVTKGKGFQGVMKRWGFKGQPATHGVSLYHRGGGSLGGASGGKNRTRVWKGKKMAGRMGNKRRTMLNLLVHKVDPKHNLVYLKGSVPGALRAR